MGEREPGKANLPPELDPEARSNAIRLSGWEWVGVGLFAVLLIAAGPRLWKMFEKFDLEADYRIPKDLSNDYWLYDRYVELAAAHYDTLVVGDSVVWGEYVTRDQTLSHYLNEQAGRERFANAGLDGTHPAALTGLLEFYGAGVKGKQDYRWLDLDGSLQWQSFQRSVEILRRRGNQVFVLVGPFNEHLLSAKSVPEYQKVKKQIEAWLKQENLPYLAPPALPSDLYADASHPLAAGYARLAQEVLKSLPSGW